MISWMPPADIVIAVLQVVPRLQYVSFCLVVLS